jgi:hypothetical protein
MTFLLVFLLLIGVSLYIFSVLWGALCFLMKLVSYQNKKSLECGDVWQCREKEKASFG